MEKLIALAGDNIYSLRAMDVYRLLDAYYGTEYYDGLVIFIKNYRPDLICEVDSVDAELN